MMLQSPFEHIWHTSLGNIFMILGYPVPPPPDRKSSQTKGTGAGVRTAAGGG